MKYMILIYGNEKAWSSMPEAESKKAFMAFMEYNQKLAASGKLVAGEQLQQTSNSRTLRSVGGKTVTTDGPFAETKEQLGGFYILNVQDEKEALLWAAQCPAVYGGSVEVRPLIGNSAV